VNELNNAYKTHEKMKVRGTATNLGAMATKTNLAEIPYSTTNMWKKHREAIHVKQV
jgi:hypothetical protein